MEIFIDGGLFEFLIAVTLGYMVNYIFLKKYLLFFFSAVSIISPLLLIFLNKGELFFCIVGLCIFNSIFLVVLLWKQRQTIPHKPLFDVKKLRDKLFKKNPNNEITETVEIPIKG
jgi:hypothetical protein